MVAQAFYYTGARSTTDLAIESGFISAIEELITQALQNPSTDIVATVHFTARS